jgi:hypothetical protein
MYNSTNIMKNISINFRCTEDVRYGLRRMAAEEGIGISQVILNILSQHMAINMETGEVDAFDLIDGEGYRISSRGTRFPDGHPLSVNHVFQAD